MQARPPTGESGLAGLDQVQEWAQRNGVPVVLFPERCARRYLRRSESRQGNSRHPKGSGPMRRECLSGEASPDLKARSGRARRASTSWPSATKRRLVRASCLPPTDPQGRRSAHASSSLGANFAHPSGSPLGYLFWLCSRFTGTVKLTILNADHVPGLSDPSNRKATMRGRKPSTGQWTANCRRLCAKMLGVPLVRLDVHDAMSFRQYLRALAAGNAEEAKKLAEKRKKM
eukprot:scaffold5085_cov247-Pinguiococcus_pyrenoidosus.AAC.2